MCVCAAAPLRPENGSTPDAFEQNVYQYESAFCFRKLERNRFSLLTTTDPYNFYCEIVAAQTKFCRLPIIPIKIFTFVSGRMRKCAGNRKTVLSISATVSSGKEPNAFKDLCKSLSLSQIHINSFESVIQWPCSSRIITIIIIIMDSFVWSSGIGKRTYT